MRRQSIKASEDPPAKNAVLLRDFLTQLQTEEETQKDRLKLDHRGLLMRIALNELDWHAYILHKQIKPTREVMEQAHVVGLGLARIVSLMLRLHETFTMATITTRREERLLEGVLDVATLLGFVEQGRRIAEQAWAGMAQITQREPNIFDFDLPSKFIDTRSHERDMEVYFKGEAMRRMHGFIEDSGAGKRLSSKIDKLLHENVYVWRDHFIGYHAHPDLDEYFLKLAWAIVQQAPQYDSFNELKTFGGITYLKYLLASTYVISLCLKHERFCEALIKKYRDVRIEDILTISSEKREFVATMREALNQFGQNFQNYTTTTLDEAWEIYNVISLTRRNVKLIEKPFPPLPVVIEFSESAIVTHLAGRHRQMEFLLDSLKSAYARDFSNNQRAREASMQHALGSFFKRHFGRAITLENVRLRLGGRELTDVDFVAIDPHLGDLLLFQLKYQDHYGHDLKAQKSRMTRFLDESMRWLDAVETWLKGTTPDMIRMTFRISKAVEVKRIRKIIVARHHAYALANCQLDEDTAYASWLQLHNAGEFMSVTQGDIRTLNGLFLTLRTHVVGASERFFEDQAPVEYRLTSLSYRINPPGTHPATKQAAAVGLESPQ